MADVTIRKSDVDGIYAGAAGDFRITIDRAGKREPRSIDLLLLGLGTCTISTVAQYLERKGLSTRDLAVELSAEFDEKHGLYKDFSLKLKVDEALPAEMHRTLAAVAKTCRIHKTLDSKPQIAVEVGAAKASAG